MAAPNRATATMLNTTFLMLVLGFTYLAVDPIVKLGYVIYHYRGVSRRSGADLGRDGGEPFAFGVR